MAAPPFGRGLVLVESRLYAGHGFCGGHGFCFRQDLLLADDAGGDFGTISPRGALLMALMGGFGMIAAGVAGPVMGGLR